jgi:hypothetical protein
MHVRSTLGVRAAQRYAVRFGWPVARGHAWSSVSIHPEAPRECTCGQKACSAPGLHPVNDSWSAEATCDPARLEELWEGRSWWPIVPTGEHFDAVIVRGLAAVHTLRALREQGLDGGAVLNWMNEWHAFLIPIGSIPIGSTTHRLRGTDVEHRGAGSWLPVPAVELLSPARWRRTPRYRGGRLVLYEAETLATAFASAQDRAPE